MHLLGVVRHPFFQLVDLVLHFVHDRAVVVDVVVDDDGAVLRVNIDLLGCIQSAAIYYLVSGSNTERESRHIGD